MVWNDRHGHPNVVQKIHIHHREATDRETVKKQKENITLDHIERVYFNWITMTTMHAKVSADRVQVPSTYVA